MTHWGPSGMEFADMQRERTPEEKEKIAERKRREAAFPNVGLEEGQDPWEHQWGLRNKKTGRVIKINSDMVYEFGPMGELRLPDTHEIVSRTLWPRPWEASSL